MSSRDDIDTTSTSSTEILNSPQKLVKYVNEQSLPDGFTDAMANMTLGTEESDASSSNQASY